MRVNTYTSINYFIKIYNLFNIFKASISKPLARITSIKFLVISKAIFLFTLKLHAITPPNALIGSHAYALLKEISGSLFCETPHGFACFITTVTDSPLIDFSRSSEANISL